MTSLFFEYGKVGKDIKKSREKQLKYINEEVAKSLKNQEMVKDFKATEGQIINQTKFERPLSEQLADRNLQFRKAFNSVQLIIDDPEEARKVVESFTDNQILEFNRYAPRIVQEVNQNFANVDADFLTDYIKNYISKQMSASNLLNFYNPGPLAVIDREKNTYLEEDGKTTTIKPYVGKIDENFIQEVTVAQFDTVKEARNHFRLLDSIRDRLIQDGKKLSQKRGPLNDEKILQNADFLQQIEQGIILQMATIDGIQGNTGMFVPRMEGMAPMPTEEELEEMERAEIERIEKERADEQFDQMLAEIERERAEQGGRGLKMTKSKLRLLANGRKPVFGRGIALIEPIEKFVPFGKYFINYPALEDGFIQIRFKSQGMLNDEKLRKKIKVSRVLKDVLLYLIEKHKVQKQKYEKLNDEEKELFNYILEVSKLKKQLGFGNEVEVEENTDDIDEDEKRFKVIVGEMRAGNNNPELKRQLLILIVKFMTEQRISKLEGQEIMNELI